ncbi:hypothetical protein JOF28_000701 [Leucobacter exalbidus]|uniref:Uncharacterized protein n=1 Tax=Leucobacter exalbidus TaxID=662960 RepID=A0A940T391_9MICO|nr:hypothetical protein [Leucobacter exalbidus]MBP1325469.1 hypothetical protein [Leucobacter exalbidus]
MTTEADRADHDFLIKYAGLTEADLSDEALREGDAELARNRAAAHQQAVAASWDVDRVAVFLNLEPASVRRAASEGALYSFASEVGEAIWFPTWQFTTSGLLPGLQEIVRALPRSYHPVTVRDLMTEPDADEMLGGLSPVQWLTDGHTLADVMVIIDGRSQE